MNITLWVATGCNLSCKYCYETNKVEALMTEETVENTFIFVKEEMARQNDTHLSIQFHGGEPLLNMKIIKYVTARAKQIFHSLSFSITTNGTLLDEDIVRFLVDNLFDVSISIDGREQTHNLNRLHKDGTGSFTDTYNGLTIAKKYLYNNIRIRMTVTPETLPLLYDNVTYFVNMGVRPIWVLDTLYDWTDELLVEYFNQYKGILEAYANSANYQYMFISASRKKGNKCNGGINNFHITPKGDIYPCIYAVGLTTFKIGNVRTGCNISSIAQYIGNNELNPNCIICRNRDNCSAKRCKLLNMIINNSLNQPVRTLCNTEKISFKISELYEKEIMNGCRR